VPRSGSTAGNTIVTVSGDGFVDETATVCKFDSTVVGPVTVQSSSVLLCESPPLAAGVYDVEISNNNEDFTLSEVQFEYYGMHGCDSGGDDNLF